MLNPGFDKQAFLERFPCQVASTNSNVVQYVRERQEGEFATYQSAVQAVEAQRRVPRGPIPAQVVYELVEHLYEATMNLLVRELIKARPDVRYALSEHLMDDIWGALVEVRRGGYEPNSIVVPRALRLNCDEWGLQGADVHRWTGSRSDIFIGDWKNRAVLYFCGEIDVYLTDGEYDDAVLAVRARVAPVILAPEAFIQLDLGDPV